MCETKKNYQLANQTNITACSIQTTTGLNQFFMETLIDFLICYSYRHVHLVVTESFAPHVFIIGLSF